MPPTADQDAKLLALQVAVAQARTRHQDLVERHEVLKNLRHYASAQVLRLKADGAFNDFQRASRALAAYISKKQRRAK